MTNPDTTTTYRSLILPIPPLTNLSNISSQPPCKPCTTCSLLAPDRNKAQKNLIKTSYEHIDLYPDFPALKASARAGCELCRLLRKSIRSRWAVRPMEEWGVGPLRDNDGLWDELFQMPWDRKVRIHRAAFTISHGPEGLNPSEQPASAGDDTGRSVVTGLSFDFGPLTRPVSSNGEEYGEIGQVLSFKVFDSRDMGSLNELHLRRLPSNKTLSAENLDLIRKWISTCKTYHPRCQVDSKHDSWLPTRLIDVGRGPEIPRLVETAELTARGPYIALSHMWGNIDHSPPLRTLSANIDAMRVEIPWTKLSRNFADAAIAIRQLGLRYIWIDSLCIIQDSPGDWAKEAATMHQVYKHAEVTIVATSATCAHTGFLTRNLTTHPAIKLTYTQLPSTPPSTLILTPQPPQDSGLWSGDIESSAWNVRGWTMQERSLSTRLLHFCPTKIYFECRTDLCSEEGEPLITHLNSRARTFELWPRNEDWMTPGPVVASLSATTTDNEKEKEKLYTKWTSTLTSYTQRALTQPTDRLPAIASVAAEMSPLVADDTYLVHAGMWRSRLARELLWQVRDGPLAVPTREYRAPSWSWAGVEARVRWNEGALRGDGGRKGKDAFEVVGVVGPGEGERRRGALRVRALAKRVVGMRECGNDERWVFGSRTTFPFDIFTAEGDGVVGGTRDDEELSNDGVRKFAEGRLDMDDKDALTRSHREIVYVHVTNGSRPSGLLLEVVDETEGERLWRRVGVASIFEGDADMWPFAVDEGAQEVTII